jgi:peptidoglycan/LPS O-acetylase OafA/YrhL
MFFEAGYTNILKIYMLFASIMIVFSKRFILPSFLQKIAYWLGLSSYLIYLLHQSLGIGIISKLLSHTTSDVFFAFATAVALVTLGSALLAIFIEKPIQNYLKRQFQRVTLKG